MVENVSRLNVWSNNLIVDFERMVQQHHESLNSFHRVGSMLEASGKIYAFRVDSVHADVIRMSSGIQRQRLGSSYLDSTAMSETAMDISVQPIQSIRRRRLACTTVVGNKELVNAPLQTLELKCPLNRMDGIDHVSVTNLFQHGLRSDRYVWMLQPKNKFWTDQVLLNDLEEFNELDEANVHLPVVNWIPSIVDAVRPRLFGYQMSNAACDHFRYSESSTTARMNQPDLEVNAPIVDMDLHFDIDVDPVEPPNVLEPTLPQIGISFSEDDRNALRRCSVLLPNISIADDLRPISSTPLAYSYRRLTNADLPGDAGDHWKLPSIVQSNSSENGENPRRRRRRRRIVPRDDPVNFSLELNDSADQNFMSVDDPRTRSIRKSSQGKWQLNKLTIPSKMSHSSAVTFLPLMLDCVVNGEPTELTASDAEMNLSAADHIDDPPASDDIDVPPAANIDIDYQPVVLDIEMDLGPVDAAPSSIPTNDVEMTIEEGLPNVDDFIIQPPMPRTPFQITAANVNVKAVTRRCMQIIRSLEADGGEATFGQIYSQLQADGQPRTPALVFSSILELANRHKFRLEKIDGLNDFVIKR